MKSALMSSKVLFSSVIVSGALLGGIAWKYHKPTAHATASLAPATAGAPMEPQQILSMVAALPSSSPSATDKEMAKWLAKARLNASDDTSWVNLGDTIMQKARETANPLYYDNAEKVYENALTTNPRNADAMVGMAWVYGERHTFDKSIDWANKALALNPKNNFAYGIIGDAEVELGDYEAAYKNLQAMLDIRPDLSSYSRGAYLLYVTGDNRKARWLMAKAISAGAPYAENTAWCRAQLGNILLSDGNLYAAEKVLTEAMHLAPNNVHILMAMAKTRTERKDYKGAIELYQKILATTPQHNALVALGDLYQITGDKANAEKTFAEVLALHERNKGTLHDHMQLAQFYADHDRNAVEALRLAEEHKTTGNVFEADILAWCYYQNGQYEDAHRLIQTALRYHTPDARMLYHAGMIALKRKDLPAGRKYLYQALSMNPDFSVIHAPRAAETLKTLGQVAQNEIPAASTH